MIIFKDLWVLGGRSGNVIGLSTAMLLPSEGHLLYIYRRT